MINGEFICRKAGRQAGRQAGAVTAKK